MKATFNPRLQRQHPENRADLRYRLARLLLLEQFDQALQEAEIALGQQNILPEDLRFVRNIVEDAKKQAPHWSHTVDEFNVSTRLDSTANTNGHDNSR